ncbi:hypothetical protein [Pseudomonas putida]|uniref:Uncharacterized protein n=1 Tax=Pseudomonas putida TaxID=303 RepID=A0A8I1EDA4_PSEPU|nr:hypothetical protein [Pseudomonas putida]MBI6883159.1 hypothetical protein [Pseudomonas putida]
MREGKLVSLPGYQRKGIALRVTAKDIKTTGVQVRRPGVYIFSGYWYGEDPKDFRSYGKIHHMKGFGRYIGSIKGGLRGHFAAKRLLS